MSMRILVTGILTRGNKPHIHHSTQGFTLLEMMLVVALIALTVGFVNLNLSPNPEDVLKREGARVAALLRQLQDESVFTGRPMAMELDELEQRYSFLVVGNDSWIALQDDELFRSRSIANPVTARLTVDGVSSGETSDEFLETSASIINPKVVVDPLGGVSQFGLVLSADKKSLLVTLNEYAQITIRSGDDSR